MGVIKKKRFSFACAERLADTVSIGRTLWAHKLTLINYKVDNNISKYISHTIIIETRKISKFVNS